MQKVQKENVCRNNIQGHKAKASIIRFLVLGNIKILKLEGETSKEGHDMRIVEEPKIVGDFGEFVTAYYLTKLGINVLRADTVCFDLFATDSRGVVFPKKATCGISVKIRDRSNTTPACTIVRKDFPKIKSHAKKWQIDPWICHLIVSKRENQKILEGFLLPVSEAQKYFAEGKRQFAISFSKLRKEINGKFAGTKRYFKWVLD